MGDELEYVRERINYRMGKGKKQKQLSPEEQRERAERRRMTNGGAPPGTEQQ